MSCFVIESTSRLRFSNSVFRLDIVFADELNRERLRRARVYHVECTPVRLIRVEDLIFYLIPYNKREDALFLLKKYRETIDLSLTKSLCKRLGVYEKLKEFLAMLNLDM